MTDAVTGETGGPFAGRVAVITSGASGIGLATALRLLAEGACVVVGDLNAANGARSPYFESRLEPAVQLLAVGLAERGRRRGSMDDLNGCVAIITGAARGQGAAEAELLAASGAKVVLTDVLVEQGEATAAALGSSALFIEQDVASSDGWDDVVASTLAAFGRVDVLVNNAAISRPLKLEDTDPDTYDLLYRVNQRSVFLGMRAVIEPMKRQGGGSIINISSVAGLQGTNTLFAYTATKWAVRGMTKSAALELARYNIRVNTIFPGVVDTPINDGNPARMNEVLVKTTPMRRLGSPSEIAEAVSFLASPRASFVTGADFAIDGGMSI